jgi:hypothetical protein
MANITKAKRLFIAASVSSCPFELPHQLIKTRAGASVPALALSSRG